MRNCWFLFWSNSNKINYTNSGEELKKKHNIESWNPYLSDENRHLKIHEAPCLNFPVAVIDLVPGTVESSDRFLRKFKFNFFILALNLCQPIHALSCYSTAQGAGGLGLPLACTTSPYCYVNFRKYFPGNFYLFYFQLKHHTENNSIDGVSGKYLWPHAAHKRSHCWRPRMSSNCGHNCKYSTSKLFYYYDTRIYKQSWRCDCWTRWLWKHGSFIVLNIGNMLHNWFV